MLQTFIVSHMIYEDESLWKPFLGGGPISRTLKAYDNGVASVFHTPSVGVEEVTLNYVGVLKDILKLNYGPLRTPLIFFRCEWMKQFDNRGDPTYVKDNVGIMVVNFRHKGPQMLEPFIFPSQTTQVFWSDEVQKPGRKSYWQRRHTPKDINRAQQMSS